MTQRPSRANRRGEHSYLWRQIPRKLWDAAVAKTAADHLAVCGDTAYHRCRVHSMGAVLTRLLQHYGDGSLERVTERL